MRRFLLDGMVAGWLALGLPASAGTGRVVKVLPEFVDLKGHTSLVPSLYERDAYQVTLRDHPERRSGMRFYIQWRVKGGVWEPLTVRLEVRGNAKANLPAQYLIDQPVHGKAGWLSHWAEINLSGEEYKRLGSVTAWRVTLWEGQTLLGEQKSFLW